MKKPKKDGLATQEGGSSTRNSENKELIHSMRIAQAVLHGDVDAMRGILQESLAQRQKQSHLEIHNVTIEKSRGELFTGGKSTPVYHVAADLHKNQKVIPRYFVVKLVLMLDEEDKNKTALRRQSYAVERRFYDSDLIRNKIKNANLTIPKILSSDLDGSKPWPALCLLMNDVSVAYPEHPHFMSLDQAKCALHWIATFHAAFWGERIHCVWERGAFWTKSSNANPGNIAATWLGTVKFLESKYPSYITSNTRRVGQWIQTFAAPISDFLAKQSHQLYGTLIHGDYKAANLLFSKNTSEAATRDGLDGGGASAVAAVDFQFTGIGLAAEDVAYLLYPDARGDWFAHESELLHTFHEILISQLILHQKGGPSTLSFEAFMKHYELARVDMTRHWLIKGWVASTEGEAKLVRALEDTLSRLDMCHSATVQRSCDCALEEFMRRDTGKS